MNKYQEAFRLFGKSIEKAMDNFTMDELIELKEADKVLQELVDRATPKKALDIQEEEDVGGHSGKCPNCHEWVSDFTGAGKHCDNCGQALEWEEGEKK